MDGSQEVPDEFVVASGDTPEILRRQQQRSMTLRLLSALAEALDGHPVGFVWDCWLRATIDDFGAKAVAVVAFIANEG
ncbi:hypothetical protein IVB42_00380 [Bradyrhizobium sp. 45]|nr:hypothetical protein [Bradyrhizobium sp. 45]